MATRRAFIFVNGQQAQLDQLRSLISQDDYLVAADGGLHFLHRLQMEPHLLIGDLDSVSEPEIEAARAHGVQIRRYPVHKNETDLELALQAVVIAAPEMEIQEIRIVAALGGRLDMTLGNIFLLMLPELVGFDVRLEDGYEEVFLIRPNEGTRWIEGEAGDRISLLPIQGPAHGIWTDGLYYPLRGENLLPERTRGISNVLAGSHATVTLQAGLLLCIHSRRAFL